MTELITIIQTLGFPIAACCAMAWYVKYITDKNDTKIETLEKTHGEALDKITKALNNNTVALTKLSERLGDNENDDKR